MNAPVLEIVRGCNLACGHCMVGQPDAPEFLPIADLRLILEKLSLAGFQMAGLTGAGELTLHPRLGEVLESFVHRGLAADLLTNGTRFREVLYPLLCDAGIRRRVIRIGFSLDGPTAEVHDRNRGSGSFARVLEAIALCRLLGLSTYIKSTLRRENLPLIRESVGLAANLGVDQWRFIAPMPTRRSIAEATIPSPNDVLEARRLIASLESASQGRIFWEGWMGSRLPPLGTCNAFRNFAVDHRGRHLVCSVLSCVESEPGETPSSPEAVGSLVTQPLRETVHAHFLRLARLLTWRLGAREVMRPADFPLCYWCFYQNGKLDWLAEHPASPWSAGILRARAHGITPLS
ncbi:MAG: radical SAM protein [Candidatus Zixiibacteriota bacterium]